MFCHQIFNFGDRITGDNDLVSLLATRMSRRPGPITSGIQKNNTVTIFSSQLRHDSCTFSMGRQQFSSINSKEAIDDSGYN